MSRRGQKPSAEDVLRGRASIDVHGLVALIHSVNPTGRGLRAADEARAYRTKAALQSLLLRRFAEHVRVEESEPGVLALSLRDTGQHAAHCPLDALDEDVRSRVRFELDTGDESDAAAADRVRGSPTDGSWAERTREALEHYDFEEAEAVLRAAHLERPADAAPALALLELLVDHLGNPPAVLALWASLDTSLRGDRRIAGAVAVAAALFGEVSLAKEQLLEVRGERAAEAWAHLARHAMRTEDAALAREARDALARESPAHPAIVALDEHLEARRLSARGDAEARLLATEGLAPSERRRMAAAVLEQYPRSAVAARVLRAIEATERRARIDALLARAEEHAPADDAAAVAAWREAISLGADPSGVAPRLEAAEERLRRERVARAAEEIAAALARGEAEAALIRALEAEAGVVEALRATLEVEPLEALSRAEEIARAAPSARAKACARAALAWTEAERAIAAAETGSQAWAPAARLLARHTRLLSLVPEVAGLRERLDELAQAERRAGAWSALEQCRAALERGELELARQSLGRVRPADLRPEERGAHGTLEALVERLGRERILDATLERRERDDRWLEVAMACEAELTRAEHSLERRRALAERAARARAQVHDAYRFAVLPIRGAEGALPPLGRRSTMTHPLCGESDGMIVAVTGGAGWIVARWIDFEGEVRRVTCLRPREASSRGAPLTLRTGDRISIGTDEGVLCSLANAGDVIVDALTFETVGERPAAPTLVGGSELAWQISLVRGSGRIFDSRTGKLRKEVEGWSGACIFSHSSLVLRCGSVPGECFAEPFDARGARMGPPIPLPAGLMCAEAEGDTLYVLCEREYGAPGSSHVLARGGLRSGTSRSVCELDMPEASECTFTLTPGALFLCRTEPAQAVVDAYARDEGGELELVWTLPLASGTVVQLAQDLAIALLPEPRAQRCARLSLAPPRIERLAPVMMGLGEALPGLPAVLPLTPSAERLRPPDERVRDPKPRGRVGAEAMVRFQDDHNEDAMSEALAYLFWRGSSLTDILDSLSRGPPLGPTLRAWVATDAMNRRRWADARGVIDAMEQASLESSLAAWCRYARGLIAYASGEIDRALEHWSAVEGASEAANTCRQLIERVRVLHAGAEAAPDDGHAALLASIREADALASAGDLDGAIAALDQHLVWRAGEPQSFARLAHWRMERAPRTAAEWLRTLEVLAELVVLDEDPSAIVLAVPGAHWPEERVREVQARARAWLDGAHPPSE